MCMVLPSVIEKAVKDFEGTIVPHDTVIDELREMAAKQDIESEDMAIDVYKRQPEGPVLGKRTSPAPYVSQQCIRTVLLNTYVRTHS